MTWFTYKKGEMGLVDIFSIILYFICVLILSLILSIAGCLINTKKKASIEVEVGLAESVKADSQLTSMLRTQMPDYDGLIKKLGQLKAFNDNKNFNFKDKIKFNYGGVQTFLDGHRELFTKKDYSEFISGLYVIYKTGKDKDSLKDTFKAVSAALFLRGLKDYPEKGEYMLYMLPIGVKFSPDDMKPSDNTDMCVDYDLCVEYLPSDLVPQTQDLATGDYVPIIKTASRTIQAIPLTDDNLAKVEFRYYPEVKSTLPKA